MSEARTLLLRVRNNLSLAGTAPQSRTDSQGDNFAVLHAPTTGDFAAVLVFNPSILVESGQAFGAVTDEGGWPVIVTMAEEFLGIRTDHIAELDSSALGRVIDELGDLQVYSRTAFSSSRIDFVGEGRDDNLDGTASGVFMAADPVDDAGRTRTRNQRALVRALKSGGLVKEPSKAAAVPGHVASGIWHNAGLITVELDKLSHSLRVLQPDDVAMVTVPSNSDREDDGTIKVSLDWEAMPALKQALTGTVLPQFFRYLVSLGY